MLPIPNTGVAYCNTGVAYSQYWCCLFVLPPIPNTGVAYSNTGVAYSNTGVSYSQYWCFQFPILVFPILILVLPVHLLQHMYCVGEQADQSGELFDKSCGNVGVWGQARALCIT